MKLALILAAATALDTQVFTVTEDPESCWKRAYGRGVGKVISSCPSDKEKDGALCYPFCKDNFNGVGPVCWENCPSSFRNDGAFCYKPKSYGRGAGYTSKDKCEKKEGEGKCEKNGLLYYPKCHDSFHNVGCCVCSPNCPTDMTDIGISCAKQSYGRTAGTPLICKPDEDESSGLCYTPCQHDATGNGPVCWGGCPTGTSNCGGALCLTPDQKCSNDILKMIKDSGKTILNIATGQPGTLIDLSKIFKDFAYPECSTW